MEDDVVLREAMSRRDSALSEARRLDDFIRMYNELRGIRGHSAPSHSSAPLSAEPPPPPPPPSAPSGGKGGSGSSDSLGGEFILDKQRR